MAAWLRTYGPFPPAEVNLDSMKSALNIMQERKTWWGFGALLKRRPNLCRLSSFGAQMRELFQLQI